MVPIYLLYLGRVVAFIVAFGMGANNVSNAIGTSVGSGAISVRNGLILAAIFEFLGTFLMGGMVTGTLKTAIISPSYFATAQYIPFAIGMFSTMVTAVVWILLATHFALPISATQTIIGGIVGFSLAEGQATNLNQYTLFVIILSWFVSPIIGAVLSYSCYLVINKTALEKGEISKFVIPAFYGGTCAILLGFILHTNLKDNSLTLVLTFLLFIGISAVASLVRHWISNNRGGGPKVDLEQSRENAEQPFKLLMVLSAAFVAFAHGSNDVSNAAGPYSTIYELYTTNKLTDESTSVPFSIILECGVGIVVGLLVLGYKTLTTVGEKITKLTYSKGYATQVSAAFTILVASALSIPISTTAILIGGIVGVGLVTTTGGGGGGGGGGDESSGSTVDFALLSKIVGGWVVTVLVGLIGTPIVHTIMKLIVTHFQST